MWLWVSEFDVSGALTSFFFFDLSGGGGGGRGVDVELY